MKQTRPLSGQRDPNMFWTWLDWLVSLGGTFTPIWSEPSTKRTGRRDPDKKPRKYKLDDKKYGQNPVTGAIWRRPW